MYAHHRMTPIIMRLDMLEVACVLERRDGPIQLAHPAVKVRVPITYGANIAFEVTDIDWVEADLCAPHSG